MLISKASGNLNVVLQVVNALLTQMDKLKSSPNVIVLTTSNITAAIGRSQRYTLTCKIHTDSSIYFPFYYPLW